MSKPRKNYTKTEKLEIVKLSLEEGEQVKEIAQRFGVSENSIYNWRAKYIKHEEAAFPGKGNKAMSESEREIARLKKELKESRLECDILKKAVGIFSRSDRKFSNS